MILNTTLAVSAILSPNWILDSDTSSVDLRVEINHDAENYDMWTAPTFDIALAVTRPRIVSGSSQENSEVVWGSDLTPLSHSSETAYVPVGYDDRSGQYVDVTIPPLKRYTVFSLWWQEVANRRYRNAHDPLLFLARSRDWWEYVSWEYVLEDL